jgi:HK97 gp10 family phage protein
VAYKSRIPKVIKQLSKNEQDALNAMGLFVTSETKKRAPVDTGRLRSSYRHDVGDHFVRIGTNVKYAIYLEYGTRKMKARSHLGPAMRQNRKKIKALAAKYLGRGL